MIKRNLPFPLKDGRTFSFQEMRQIQPGGMNPERLRLLGQKIDLNSATVQALSQVRGIGPKLAPEVVRERKRRGRFKSVEELLQVKGVGHKRLRQAREYLTVRPL